MHHERTVTSRCITINIANINRILILIFRLIAESIEFAFDGAELWRVHRRNVADIPDAHHCQWRAAVYRR